MITTSVLAVVMIVLLVVFSNQLHSLSRQYLAVRIVKYLIVASIIAYGILLIIFAIGETTQNDFSGLLHLLPIILIGIIVYLLLKGE